MQFNFTFCTQSEFSVNFQTEEQSEQCFERKYRCDSMNRHIINDFSSPPSLFGDPQFHSLGL